MLEGTNWRVGYAERVSTRWFLIPAAVIALVFALYAVLRGEEPIEQQIGKQAYDESCSVTVSTNERVVRRWPGAAEAELISCDTSENDPFPNHLMDYARYASEAALAERLKTAPPDDRYCTLGSTVVVTFQGVPDGFTAMCAKRGGTLHS